MEALLRVRPDLPVAAIAAALLSMSLSVSGLAATLEVPAQYPSIQAAVDAASNGDLVLVAPGTYVESVSLSGKTLTLASLFFTTGNPDFIEQTVIDGGGSSHAIFVSGSVGPGTTIAGFTIQNADDGIRALGSFQLFDSRITGTVDGLDYFGGGGLVKGCVIDGNSDDGIDLDSSVAVVIENNAIIDNGGNPTPDGDGIEIRLQPYSGPTLDVVIRDNRIEGNSSDGIQLIGYEQETNRVFRIEGNTFVDNRLAAIGMMCCTVSNEDLQGASLPERIHIARNTFVGSDHAISGGDDAIVLDNLFVSNAVALGRVDGASIAAWNGFWLNGVDDSESNVDAATSLYQDPLLGANQELLPGSPAEDAGTAFYEHLGETVLDLPASAFAGSAPDLGAFEIGGMGTMNEPPFVDAGRDQVLPSGYMALLEGRATDDGLPAGSLERAWSVVSGPGTVVFGDPLAESTTASFSQDGSYVLRLSADDSDLTGSDDVRITLMPEAQVLERALAAGESDAEEALDTGSVDLSSPTLELGALGNQIVGLRWEGVAIPPGSQIHAAWVQFQAADLALASAALEIRGERSANAAPFSALPGDLSSRVQTSTRVTWEPPAWLSVGDAGIEQRTQDLSAVIDEIVNGTAWEEGNALALFLTGSDRRTAEAFEGTPGGAPVLHLNFSPPRPNQAPLVDAGPDRSIVLPQTASLAGNFVDDALPEGQAVSVLWTPVSGPGQVTIDVPTDPATQADFSAPGVYVLRLAADDGELSGSEEMSVSVAAPGAQTLLDIPVAASSDDAEEPESNKKAKITSSDLELSYDLEPQTVGLRFTGVDIPAGSSIEEAWVQFTADESHSEPASLVIEGEDADDPATFDRSVGNLSTRPRTSASVAWNPPAWSAGATEVTPGLASVVQEVVDRAGWASGNALALLVTGAGTRTAEAYDASAAAAPRLFVEVRAPACADSIDNDGDGSVDFPDDAGCASASADTENPACSDGIDNNGDGNTDFPDDAGCSDASGTLELADIDADADGVPDVADNCRDVPNPFQIDTNSDGCGNRCDADLSNDGVVGGADFTLWAPSFGKSVPPANPDHDFTGGPGGAPDGFVGGPDFSLFGQQFGGPPGPGLEPDWNCDGVP
jgi:hypothetical protein